ncbi:MAG: GGDEF domain-containing protein, partial [Christensenellales bacterium]
HAKDKQEIWISRGVFLFALFSGAALIAFLLGSERIYVIIYSIGFIILIVYMIKATIHKMLSAYNQSVKTEFYKSLAFTDVLTEVKNRNAFIKEQNDSPVNENTCCVVMDMNRLKLVNDTFGHSAGDQLIRCSAKVIYDAFSDIGVCYRIGGDEFAVICRNTDESAVKGCIEKMNKLIVEFNSDADPKISLSCGYAFGGNGITDIMDLHDAADREMYLDKKAKHYVRE